jgi:glucosamine kinase
MVTMCKILAIDAGGTTTRAVVVEPSGHCHGLGLASSGNPVSGGFDAAVTSLVSATQLARAAADTGSDAFTAAVIAMAGAGHGFPLGQVRALLVPLGLRGELEVVSDALATFCAGTLRPDGYVLVAGTGAVAARVEHGRLAAVSDGLGWLLGDAGSGYWIGHRVAGAVARFLDGRGPQTALTGLLLDALGIPATQLALAEEPARGRPAVLAQLVDALYALRPVELSRFAPLAFQARDDDVARAILADAASALAATLASVRDPAVDGPLVLGGSVLASGLLAALMPGVATPVLVPDGLVGAAVLGLRSAGVDVDDGVFQRITGDIAALRNTARREMPLPVTRAPESPLPGPLAGG